MAVADFRERRARVVVLGEPFAPADVKHERVAAAFGREGAEKEEEREVREKADRGGEDGVGEGLEGVVTGARVAGVFLGWFGVKLARDEADHKV